MGARGKEVNLFTAADCHLSGGQVSDYKGAAVLLDTLPQARELLADRGYDAAWFRHALSRKGITPCTPGRHSRKTPVVYDKEDYKQRHKIEIMFGRLKDWRRIAMRYDRCAHTFFFGHLSRCHCHLLWLMSPEPTVCCKQRTSGVACKGRLCSVISALQVGTHMSICKQKVQN